MAFEGEVKTSDAALIRRTAAGDRAAFFALARRYQAAVYRYALTLTHDAPTAEEVLGETFLAAWKGARRFQGDAPVKIWLLAFARHCADRRPRAGSGAAADLPALSELSRAAGWGLDDAGRLGGLLARREAPAEALAALARDDREILVLCDGEGLSGAEAAAVTDSSAAAAETRLHRARLRLMARLRQGIGDGR